MFLHIDCNSYFASCEIATDPSLEGRPVVVANVNEAGGGIILALNQQAKALGLRRGNPVFQVKKILEEGNVAVCRADHKKYHRISQQLMDAVKAQDIVVNFVQYSVDEFFGELPIDDAAEARHYISLIKNHIETTTRIPVSCGFAPTYTLAKVATHYAKNYAGYHGICVMLPDHRQTALRGLHINDVWGIGRQLRKKMVLLGVATALDFANLDLSKVKLEFPTQAVKTYRELNGEPCITIERGGLQSSIMQSRTFGFMITELDQLQAEVRRFAADCAAKLRHQKGECGSVTVFVATNRHRADLPQYRNSASVKLAQRSSDTVVLMKSAEKLLAQIFKPAFQYKQAGVILADIRPEEGHQLDMFTVEEDEKRRRLMEVADRLNEKFGSGTVEFR